MNSNICWILFLIVFYWIVKLFLNNINLKNKLEKKDVFIKDLQEDINIKLKKAQDIHKKILPKNLAEPSDFFISSYYQPAEYIGGDYYNIFKIYLYNFSQIW